MGEGMSSLGDTRPEHLSGGTNIIWLSALPAPSVSMPQDTTLETQRQLYPDLFGKSIRRELPPDKQTKQTSGQTEGPIPGSSVVLCGPAMPLCFLFSLSLHLT